MSTRIDTAGKWVAALVAAGLIAVPAAHAQQQPPPQQQQQQPPPEQQRQQPPQQPPEPQVEVTDEKLHAFADAYVEIEDIREQYQPQLEEVEDPERAQELQREANLEMMEVIEAQGMTPEEYNEIAMAVSQDEELRTRAIEIIENER